MRKLEKVLPQKQTNKLYIGVIQDENGRIQRILPDADYEHAWLKVTAESKAMRGFWTIFNLNGQFIDGNFKVPNIR
jgi:hypothetical protein